MSFILCHYSEPFEFRNHNNDVNAIELAPDLNDEDRDDYLKAMLTEFVDETIVETNFNIWCSCHRIQLIVKDFIHGSNTFKELQKVLLEIYTLNLIPF